jgi:hypothetical protein
MDNSAEKQSTKKSWITEGIIIAFSPLIAYILLYFHEAGFLDTFSIPREFLTLELSSVIFTSSIILVLVTLGFVIVIPLIRYWNVIEEKMISSLILAVMFFSQFLWFLILGLKLFSVIFLTLFVFYILIIFISPIKMFVRRSFNRIFGQDLAPLLLSLVFLVSIINLMWPIGRMEASSKEEFPVIGGSPEMVILRIYGDKLICAPFDRATKEVKRVYVILKIADDLNLKLSLEKVGPLHIEKQPTDVSGKSVVVPTDSLEELKKK